MNFNKSTDVAHIDFRAQEPSLLVYYYIMEGDDFFS